MWNVFFLSVLGVCGVGAEVKPLAGPSIRGELIELTPETVVVQTGSGQQNLDVAGLWEVIPDAEAGEVEDTPSVWVELVDGSRLCALQYTVTGGAAVVHLTTGEQVSLRTRSIHAVQLRDHSGSPDVAGQWKRIVSDKPVGDIIVIRRTESLDQLEGVLHDITQDIVRFEFDGETIDVNRKKLDGFVYYHPVLRELPNRICQVTDASGSRWNVKSFQTVEEGIELVTVAGVKLSLPVGRVRKIDFSSGNTVWLSDLEPESVEWRPYVSSQLPPPRLARLFYPREDIGLALKPLSLGGNVYSKGLAIRSRTELVYRLTDDFRQFHAIVGIDDHVRNGGNVDLAISGDGKILFSKNITGDAPAFPLDLDITGVRRLKILVDFGQELDIADHLNLCDARMTK